MEMLESSQKGYLDINDIVEYPDNKIEIYSSLWYKLDKIKEIVEKYLKSKN